MVDKEGAKTIRVCWTASIFSATPALTYKLCPPPPRPCWRWPRPCQNPRLLLDEVTAALHYDEIQVLFGIMRELKAEGMSIIYVTHRMNEVFEICDTATIMRSGETVMDAAISELTLDDIVYYMTGQRPEVAAGAVQCEIPTHKEPVVEVEDLEVYPKVWGISLKAYKGEIVGIGGLQGQGQPELIRVLLGAEKVAGARSPSGPAREFEIPGGRGEPGHRLRLRGAEPGGHVPPAHRGGEHRGGEEGGQDRIAQYLTPRSLRAFANSAVQKYDIKIGALHHRQLLSGGNQQKLVIARWIAMNPVLLLLDDPTKGVDIHSRREIHKILRRCAERMTIILSSSDSRSCWTCPTGFMCSTKATSAMCSATTQNPGPPGGGHDGHERSGPEGGGLIL